MSSAAVRLPGAVAPTFEVLPGVAHSFVDAVETAFLPRRVCDRFAADAGLAII
jgi:hypothetical protein